MNTNFCFQLGATEKGWVYVGTSAYVRTFAIVNKATEASCFSLQEGFFQVKTPVCDHEDGKHPHRTCIVMYRAIKKYFENHSVNNLTKLFCYHAKKLPSLARHLLKVSLFDS